MLTFSYHPFLGRVGGRFVFGSGRALAASLLLALPGLAAAEPGPPVSIRVPEGFEVSRVASAPLIAFPVMGGFDDRGRLFVAENVGVNLDQKGLAQQLPNRVSVLEDVDGDGIFDRGNVFVDQLTFPQGVQWHDGALYVASPPAIWRFEDSDGDGRADGRKQLASGFNFTGNAADVHGPFLHPNGRLYWCHGRKGHEVHQADGTLVSKNLGARVWSCRPDGSDIQVHAGGGMDNPCELTFNQEGDIFGTVNIFNVNPRSDAVVHWLHGGVYSRPDQEKVMAEFKHTGDLLPPVAFLGHVAPAGIHLLRGDALGAEYRGNLFLAEFNTRRIMRVSLQPAGASFRGQPEIFASSPDPAVHFTDVFEDADGSLLVIDTGAWFRSGCPTSGAARTDVAGGIYRIRRKGARPVADPRGAALDWDRLPAAEAVKHFSDPRPAVRERAIAAAVRGGASGRAALGAALEAASPLTRSNAVWALTRIGTPEAAALVRRALRDPEAGVRQAACQSAFVTRDKEAVPALIGLLGDVSDSVRREAARALGPLGDGGVVRALLAAAGAGGRDIMLDHALTYALIEVNRPDLLSEHLADDRVAARRASLVALDQLAPERVTADPVFASLRSADATLRSAALRIASKRPRWAANLPAYLDFAFAASDPGFAETGARLLKASIGTAETRAWLRGRLAPAALPAVPAAVALEAITAAGANWDEGWREFLLGALRSTDVGLAVAALQTAAVHRERGFSAAFAEIAHDSGRPTALRVAALQAAAAGGVLDGDSFHMLLQPFASAGTPEVRQQAAAVLARSRLSREHLLELAAALPKAGPLELPQLVRAFQRGPADPAIAAALTSALRQSPVRWSMKPDDIFAVLRRFPPPAMDHAAPLLTELLDQRAATDTRVAELEKIAAGGDAARGRQAFAAGAGGCIGCHRIGDTGTRVGPDLSEIGRIRTTRDLLEAIAFPSASIARGYETFQVETKQGEALIGTIVRELADEVVIGTFDGRETTLVRSAITRFEPVATSLMPPGLDRAVEPAMLADLIAFLQSLQ